MLLTDITGAFDRVDSELLIDKCAACGVCDKMLRFLTDYLEPRRATVNLDGVQSDEHTVRHQVFQGTVLGPPLWNVFFDDISDAVPDDFDESKFADDLNVFKRFHKQTSHDEVFNALRRVQTMFHEWGLANK